MWKPKSLLILTALFFIGLNGFARGSSNPTGDETSAIDVPYTEEALLAGMIQARDLHGYTVFSPSGKMIGVVQDLLMDLECGCVAYAVIETGAHSERDDNEYPIPLSFLQPDIKQRSFRLAAEDQALLEYAPKMSDFPSSGTLSEPLRDMQLNDFWASTRLNPDTARLMPGENLLPAPIGSRSAYLYDYGSGIDVSPGSIVLLSDILEQPIYSPDGTALGSIAGFVIDILDTGIAYVDVQVEGYSTVFPVPLPLFTIDLQRSRLDLSVTEDWFDKAPALATGSATEYADPSLNEQIRSYWKDVDAVVSFRRGMLVRGTGTYRINELIGFGIVNDINQHLGEIRDFIITESGAVPYALVELSGHLSPGDSLLPIPLSNLELNPFLRLVYLDLSRADLENAPRFSPGALPLDIVDWDRQIRNFWVHWLKKAEGEMKQEYFEARTGAGLITPASYLSSSLLDKIVDDTSGREVGRVSDLLINVRDSQWEYALVKLANHERREILVPADRFARDASAERIAIDASVEVADAAPQYFAAGGYLYSVDSHWDAQYQAYWGDK